MRTHSEGPFGANMKRGRFIQSIIERERETVVQFHKYWLNVINCRTYLQFSPVPCKDKYPDAFIYQLAQELSILREQYFFIREKHVITCTCYVRGGEKRRKFQTNTATNKIILQKYDYCVVLIASGHQRLEKAKIGSHINKATCCADSQMKYFITDCDNDTIMWSKRNKKKSRNIADRVYRRITIKFVLDLCTVDRTSCHVSLFRSMCTHAYTRANETAIEKRLYAVSMNVRATDASGACRCARALFLSSVRPYAHTDLHAYAARFPACVNRWN